MRRRVDRATERRFYDMLIVEKFIRDGAVFMHEDGHREFRIVTRDLPIETQVFGWRVATPDEALLFPENPRAGSN
jgi:hypothetical protein